MNLKKLVLKERFLAPGEKSEFDMYRRVAKAISYNKKEEQEFYRLMSEGKFLPNTPTLVNAGRKGSSNQLAACFVLPIEDSMESIFTTLKNAAIIQKTGGGVGYDFSNIRPKGSTVGSSSGVASGPVSFMEVYDAATNAIKQGGIRRGANMGILRIDHPDIEEFIACKEDITRFNNFNISVAITDEFLDAVKNDKLFSLRFAGKEYKKVNARKLWNKIATQAHKTGEPGIVFIDRVNEKHPLYDKIEATNPCGEQPLLPYEACNLGSMNLSKYVINGKFNKEEFKKDVKIAVRFLDNVIDKGNYPLEKITEVVKSNRKIGLGVMGYADMLIKLGLVYGSDEAIETTEKIASIFREAAIEGSQLLAKEKGSFPNIENSKWTTPMRNATVTTIAPTGTISILAETSGGIEPIFMPYYYTYRMDRKFLVIHPLFEEMLKERGRLEEFKELAELYSDDLSKLPLEKFDPELHRLFIDAHTITPKEHIDTQAIWQKYIDNAVSKTINLPEDATVEEVAEAYSYAYEKGLKGLTVYRDGSRGYAVLSSKDEDAEKEQFPKVRDEWQKGYTTKVPSGCGNLWITINEDSTGYINEVFISNGSNGGCPNIEGEARLISLALRNGVSMEEVLDQLESVVCPKAVASKKTNAKSCSDAVAKTIRKYINLKKGNVKDKKGNTLKCPNCEAELATQEGCVTCKHCGWSLCS